MQFYQQALKKIPESKHNWEISLHVFTAWGDVCFNLKEITVRIFSLSKI